MKKKRYSLYLVGSVSLWKKEFKRRYSGVFNKKTKLFEPGTSGIPDDHRKIIRKIAEKDAGEIRRSDAVLIYMKNYTPLKYGGPAGVDSSWECGYAYGIGKPLIAIIDDLNHLAYFEEQWMLTFHIDAYLTTNKKVVDAMSAITRFNGKEIILCSSKNAIEEKIVDYLDRLGGNS